MKKKLLLVVAGIGLVIGVNGQESNTSPLPSGETVIGGHLHAGAGNEVWTSFVNLYFNYRGSAAATYFWNLGGGTGKSLLTLLSNGNVGVGLTSPNFRFHIIGGNPNSDLMTLGTTTTGNFALTSADGGAYGLFGGVSNTGRAWLQAGRYDSQTAYDLLLQASGGNVGIGTISPSHPLTVKPTSDIDAISWRRSIDGNEVGRLGVTGGAGTGRYGWIGLWNSIGTQSVQIDAGGGNSFINSGNVLIGKTTQTNTTYKLDVAGKVRADEITVNTTGADFVFEPTYKLRTLAEVETFINAHKHLPDVATAADMQTNGVSMGDMQAKLLQKVEELTLYVIEQNKEIKKLKEEVTQLKNRN